MTYQFLNLVDSPILSIGLEDELTIFTAQNIYQLDSNHTLQLKQPFKVAYSNLSYKTTDNYSYVVNHNQLGISKKGDFSYTTLGHFYHRLITDGDNIVSLESKLKGYFYTPEGTIQSFQLPGFDNWSINHFNGAVLIDKTLYWVDREGVKRQHNVDKLDVPSKGVWQFDLVTKQATDITEDLPCFNMLARPFGPIGTLVTNESKTYLYISTEEGIFKRPTNGSGWTKVLSNWGNLKLFSLGGDNLLAYSAKDGYYTLLFYLDGKWYSAGTYFNELNKVITNVVLRGDKLYFLIKGAKGLGVVDLTKLTPLDPTIELTTYLNLEGVTSAINTDKGLVVGNDSLWLVDTLGNKTKLTDVGESIKETVEFNGSLLLATKSSLKQYSEGNLTTVIDNGADNSKVAACDTMAAYLVDKTVTILNTDLETVASITLDNSYVTDIAVKDNQLFVCGFDNRKRNRVPVQVAFLFFYELVDSELKRVGHTWYYDAADLGNDMADTRAYYMEVVGDKLAVLGESAGGNTIYRWNGKDLVTRTTVDIDAYTTPFNSKSAHMSYYCLVDIESKEVVRGQFALARLPKGFLSNTSRNRSLFSDGESIYVGMKTTAYLPRRDKFADQPIPEYKDGDASLLKVDSSMKTRNYWTTPGNGDVVYFDGKVAVISTKATNLYCTKEVELEELEDNTYLVVFA